MVEWLTLTHRQMEMMLWQLLLDMGGEISVIPPEDKPNRSVMFYDDGGGYFGMIANEGADDVIRGSSTEAVPARRAEAGEKVAHQAEEFLDHLEKRWPEVTDMDHWRDALLEAIAELRMLPDRNNSLEQPHAS